MDKRTIVLVIVVCAVVFSIGIFAGRFIMPTEIPVSTPTPISTPTPTPIPWATPSPEITTTPQINEERALVKQWLKMHFDEEELEDIDEWIDRFMDQLQRGDLHPIEIYRGSLIFYEKSYGYVYIPELDDGPRQMPPDWSDTKFVNLVKKKGGTTSIIFFPEPNVYCACFPTLSGAESFLAEFWSIS